MEKPLYSRQFIAGVEEYVKETKPELIEFYHENFARFPAEQARADFKDLIYDTITNTFKGEVYREQIAKIMTTVKASRLKKRTRWETDYIEKLSDIKPESKKHPLYQELLHYSGDPLELIEKKKEATKAWKARLSSYFYEFPGHKTVGSASLMSSFKTDLILIVWDYILEKLEGDIPFFFRSYPEDCIEIPLFGSSSFKILPEAGSEKTLFDEDGNFVLSISIDEGSQLKSYKVMDATDINIFTYIIHRFQRELFKPDAKKNGIKTRSSTEDEELKIEINAHQIAYFLYGSKPNSKTVDDIANRCYKLADYTYNRVIQDGTVDIRSKIYLFSKVAHDRSLDENGQKKNTIEFIIGKFLYDAIVGDRLVRITENNLNRLNHSASKILYYAFERDRVSLFQKDEPGEIIYTYAYFQKIMHFKSSSKDENLQIIEDSLNDFINHHVCIELYARREDGSFYIKFKELSEDEIRDLRYGETNLLRQKNKAASD